MNETPNDKAANDKAAGETTGAAPDATTDGATAPHTAADGTAPTDTASTGTATTETTSDAATQQRSKRRRRGGLIVLSLVAIVAGALGSWAFNRGEPTRQDRDAAIIRAAIDPSTYVAPGDYNNVTVPIRNDSPYAVTVIGLYLPTAPKILWNGAWTVIQPGETVDLRVNAPFACPAIPHTLKRTGAVPVLLRVLTVNGDSHASLRTSVSGVIQYAADYCPAPTVAKRKA